MILCNQSFNENFDACHAMHAKQENKSLFLSTDTCCVLSWTKSDFKVGKSELILRSQPSLCHLFGRLKAAFPSSFLFLVSFCHLLCKFSSSTVTKSQLPGKINPGVLVWDKSTPARGLTLGHLKVDTFWKRMVSRSHKFTPKILIKTHISGII